MHKWNPPSVLIHPIIHTHVYFIFIYLVNIYIHCILYRFTYICRKHTFCWLSALILACSTPCSDSGQHLCDLLWANASKLMSHASLFRTCQVLSTSLLSKKVRSQWLWPLWGEDIQVTTWCHLPINWHLCLSEYCTYILCGQYEHAGHIHIWMLYGGRYYTDTCDLDEHTRMHQAWCGHVGHESMWCIRHRIRELLWCKEEWSNRIYTFIIRWRQSWTRNAAANWGNTVLHCIGKWLKFQALNLNWCGVSADPCTPGLHTRN